jgi:alkylhydroperoxidase/carboxymuconolactone decarboxylase family protein YurZ
MRNDPEPNPPPASPARRTSDLSPLLARPGLDRGTRLLVLSQVAIGPADWALFDAVLAAARRERLARGDFEEALLQATLFFGFPRLVSAFERLAAAWPADAPTTAGGEVPTERRAAAGRALFAAIYGRNDATVRAHLRALHAEFHDFVLEAAYGRILARPGLPPRTRELLAVGALAALRQVPQLVAHARGALGFGAARDEVRESIVCALGDVPEVDDLVRRIGRDGGP